MEGYADKINLNQLRKLPKRLSFDMFVLLWVFSITYHDGSSFRKHN